MDNLKLKNQLCFPIYALSRQVTLLYKPFLEELNLTYTQYLVLLVLWEKDSICVRDLGEKLWLDSGTLTPLLKRMQEKKLITRNRSTEDERRVDIALTQVGIDLEKSASRIPEKINQLFELDNEQANRLKVELKDLLEITRKKCTNKDHL
ncbi:MarR family winged helix-turn-helix transcriptional regulator [Flavobacterium sp. HSC-61S13]|uniref:MarR family winged helix-turn-helix transcriptional regulator n=1 Tax=Flavobacterium sp. HSC-61S13 TaxID=2910963 RepID=UPI00209EE076|nr:MarR family transcriptional regulator [Flavobacterium sp. HSC-61S13]MCP1997255.1 DNA-binding MarR family transcriptional regulator [Flavobacterium sp. HSC-61S13]